MCPAGVPCPTCHPGPPRHLVQPSAIQHGRQLVEAGLGGVQQELDSQQVLLKQTDTQRGRQ